MEDLAIKNGLVVTPYGTIIGGLTVKSGKITQVGGDGLLAKAGVEVDAKGNYVLPGLIDSHSHFGLHEEYGPSGAFGPEIRTESEAAAIGGITTLQTTSDYPRFKPELSRLESQKRHKEEGSKNSFVDFKITQFIVNDDHIKEIPSVFKEGCTSFKFSSLYRQQDWGFTYKGYQMVGSLGPHALAMQHAEQIQIIDKLKQELMDEGRTDLKAWFEARPAICESMDIATAGLIGLDGVCTIYIVHTSAKQSIDVIKFFKQMGVRVWAETCPHYLAKTEDEPLGIEAKVMPPLRDETHVEHLWQAVANGTIDTIGQDSVLSELRRDRLDKGIWMATSGWPGMGTMLPVMMTYGVHKGRITMEKLVKLTSENTARAFCMYPRKGVLSPGSDADIVIVDPNQEWVLGVDTLKGASNFTPWEGTAVKGKAVKTFLRGKLVAEDGHLVAETPGGEYVEPILL